MSEALDGQLKLTFHYPFKVELHCVLAYYIQIYLNILLS
jgi:hypothetical protein